MQALVPWAACCRNCSGAQAPPPALDAPVRPKVNKRGGAQGVHQPASRVVKQGRKGGGIANEPVLVVVLCENAPPPRLDALQAKLFYKLLRHLADVDPVGR